MADEKKKPEEENEPKPPQVEGNEPPEEEKRDPLKEEKKPDEKAEEKPADEKQDDENGEGTKPEDKPEDIEPEQEKTPPEAEPPKLSVEDELRAENFALKTQIEAIKLGFSPDCIEDAVVLAENIVKRDGSDITTALQAVAKKYPDWKATDKDSKKSGFRVGGDSSGSKSTSDDKLDRAFGLKKKG